MKRFFFVNEETEVIPFLSQELLTYLAKTYRYYLKSRTYYFIIFLLKG